MFKNILLVLISVSIALLGGELVLRYVLKAWPFEPGLYFPEYLTAKDLPLRWRFSPAGGRNSLGLRNREIGPKAPDSYRILFLGDSLIWSGETRSAELYTEVLERRLNVLKPALKSIEIINAGVPGYTTYQELEFLRLYGLAMQPDWVILGFVFNDLYCPYLHKPTRNNLLGREPNARRFRFDTERFPGIFFKRSYLAHELVYRIEILWQRVSQRPEFPFEQREDFYLAWKDYAWETSRELLKEMRSVLDAHGMAFSIVVFPVSDQVNEQYRQFDLEYVLYPQSEIRAIADEFDIPLLDLTESLYKQGGAALFSDYLHLNPTGNDVVATVLESYLVDHLAAGF